MKFLKNKLFLVIVSICVLAVMLFILFCVLLQELDDVGVVISDEIQISSQEDETLVEEKTVIDEGLEMKPGTVRKLENAPLQVAYNSISVKGGTDRETYSSGEVILELVEDGVILISYGPPNRQDMGQKMKIFKKDPNRSMESILSDRLDGEKPEICLPIIKEKADFSETAFIYRFTNPHLPEVEEKWPEPNLDQYSFHMELVNKYCGKDILDTKGWFYDTREGMNEYYFQYGKSWYDVLYLYDKDMNKVKWHETIEPVK